MEGRGTNWVVLQFLLFALFVFEPRLGPAWPLGTVFGVVGYGLVALGAGILLAGFWKLGRGLTPFPKPRQDAQLVTTGIYALVRHPLYCGLLLAAIGWSLASTNCLRLLVSAALAVFFDLKATHEERLLEAHFGAAYIAYRRTARKLIPGIW